MDQGVIEGMAPDKGKSKYNPRQYDWTDYFSWRMANKCGISRDEIVERVGCSRKTVTDWFSGKTGAVYDDEKDARHEMFKIFGTKCGEYAALYVFITQVLPKFESLMRMTDEQIEQARNIFFGSVRGL